MTDGKLDAVFFKKIKTDIHTFPKQYALAGKWLDENYWDDDKVWRAIERRSSKLLEKSFQREDRQESPSFIRPDSDLGICKVLQAVAVVDMGFWPDLEHLLARYKEAANAIPHNFRTITERTSTRGKIVKFLDELLPFYREHQAGLVCRWHGLYNACEDLIEKHEQIGVLNELDNKRVCLLTWLIGCPDLGAKRLNLTEFENIPWSLTCGTEPTPHRAKVCRMLETCTLLSKWEKLVFAAKDRFGIIATHPLLGFNSAKTIAKHYGLEYNTLRKQLERLRKKNLFDNNLFIESQDRGKNKDKYLYDVSRVESIIQKLSIKRPS